MFDLCPLMRLATWLAAAAIWLALPGCRTKHAEQAKPVKVAAKPVSDVEEIGWMRLDPGPRPPASMLAVKPADLPAYYRSLYRIKPDRRVLYAVEEIDRIASARRSPATLSLRFSGGGWALTLGEEPVGTLPEIATFADCDRLLKDWTARALAKHPIASGTQEPPELAAIESDLTQGSAERTLAALRQLNALAAKHSISPRLVAVAARGAVWLTIQTYDPLQLSDPLVGHALALRTLAQALEPGSLQHEEVLLLRVMGYETAAAEASQRLIADAPARFFANFDSVRLRAAAEASGATPRTQYLSLLEQARLGGRERWYAAFRKTVWTREVEHSSLTAVLALGDYQSEYSVAQALTANALVAVSSQGGRPAGGTALWGPEAWPDTAISEFLSAAAPPQKPAPQARTRAFEEAVLRRAQEADGPLWDRESVRAFYRAGFFAGIHQAARYLFDQYGSADAAEKYANAIADPAPGTASELKQWMLNRVAAGRGKDNPKEAIRDLDGFRHIGVVPIDRAVYFVINHAGSSVSHLRRDGMSTLFRRIDSRPSGLATCDDAAWALSDLRITERCLRALAAEAPIGNASESTHLFTFDRDAPALRRVAADSRYRVYDRTVALVKLSWIKDPDLAFRRARFLELMDENPEETAAAESCVQMLRNARDFRGAEEIVKRWFAKRLVPEHDLEWAHMVTIQADLLVDQKKWAEAWKVIQPAVATGKGDALDCAERILEGQQAWDDALAMARSTLARYPDSTTTITSVARILWRQQQFDECAAFLTGSSVLRKPSWEGEIARAFGLVFAEGDPHAAQNAFVALRKRNVKPEALAALARNVGFRGNHKLAYGLLSQIQASGPTTAGIQIWTHEELEKADGPVAAAEWLRSHVEVTHQLAVTAFQLRRYPIVWQTDEDPARASKDDEIQLLRAASLLYLRTPDDPRREDLLRYFEGRPENDFVVYGRFLLGKAGEEEIFRRIKDLTYVCSVGWLMGLKAASEGDFEKASDWFEVSVETGAENSPPIAWSIDTLYRWQQEDQPLPSLARKKIF